MSDEKVVVDKKLFLDLVEDSADLHCLKEKGVLQWEKYGEAMADSLNVFDNMVKTYLN